MKRVNNIGAISLPTVVAIALVVALGACDLLFGINNFSVKIVNHTSTDFTLWWSGLDEAEAKSITGGSTSDAYPVKSSVAPLEFLFYGRPAAGGTQFSLKYVIGEGWNYTLGLYAAGSTFYLQMDEESR